MSDPAYSPREPVVRDPAYGAPGYPAGYTAAPARRTYGWGSLAVRLVLSLLGAAGMIVGAFLVWVRTASVKGVDISDRAFIQTNANMHTTFVKSVGFAFIVLGLLAIVGLAPRSGWLTSFAGALGIAGLVVFGIQLQRAAGTSFPSSVGIGAWLALAGGVVGLIGGFFGTRARAVAYPAAPAAGPPPAVVE